MLGYKVHLNKFRRIEIIKSTCSNYNGIQLEIDYKKKCVTYPIILILRHILYNKVWLKEETKSKIFKYFEQSD